MPEMTPSFVTFQWSCDF